MPIDYSKFEFTPRIDDTLLSRDLYNQFGNLLSAQQASVGAAVYLKTPEAQQRAKLATNAFRDFIAALPENVKQSIELKGYEVLNAGPGFRGGGAEQSFNLADFLGGAAPSQLPTGPVNAMSTEELLAISPTHRLSQTYQQPTQQPIQQQQQNQAGQYVKVGDAFFRQTEQGLQAVSDPAALQGLKSGQIPSTQQQTIAGGAQRFAATSEPLRSPELQAQAQALVQPASATGLTDSPEVSNIKLQAGLPSDLTSISLDDVIKKVSTYFGLDEVNKEIKDLDDDSTEEIASINRNPWLSESLRTRKVNAAEEKHRTRKDAAIDRLKLRQDVVGLAIKVYQDERDYKKDLLFKQLDLQQKQISEQRLSETSDIREYKLVQEQGFTGTFLQFKKQFGAGTKPTESDLQAQEARTIESVLLVSRGKDGFVDPGVYLQQKTRSRMSPSEFDGRFKHLLSSQERKRLGIEKGGVLDFGSL